MIKNFEQKQCSTVLEEDSNQQRHYRQVKKVELINQPVYIREDRLL